MRNKIFLDRELCTKYVKHDSSKGVQAQQAIYYLR